MATHFVTGGTGLVGQALIRRLREQGHPVAALGRSPDALYRLADLGADPVPGDLLTPGAWQYDAADADIVWHLGLPRARTPLRGGRVRKEARMAWRGADHLIADRDPGRPVVTASHVLAWGEHGPGAIDDTTPAAPVAMGHWALAAEDALSATPLRAVRLGWVYGPGGMFAELVAAIRRGAVPHCRARPESGAVDQRRRRRARPAGRRRRPSRDLRRRGARSADAGAAGPPDLRTVGSLRPDRLTPRMAGVRAAAAAWSTR